MSRLSNDELDHLTEIAHHLREVFAERGHRVGVAMDVDPSFGSGRSVSSVTRDLVIAAVSEAASARGMDFRPVNGSGRELRYMEGFVDRRYRVRRATRRADGTLVVQSSSDSALAADDDNSFVNIENWVFAWTLTDDSQIGEVVVAEVIGYLEGSPGSLVLRAETTLGVAQTAWGHFEPTEGGLEGFEDEGGEEDTGFGTS